MSGGSKRESDAATRPRKRRPAFWITFVALLFASSLWVEPAAAQGSRATRSFTDVAFVSAGTLFASGCRGVYKSVNGGRSWARQYSSGGKQLRGIDFIDARRGWAVGGGGLILSTTNGGRTWVKRVSGTKRDLVDVDFVDRLHGWAVGGPAIILSTSDGGRTWRRQLMDLSSTYRYAEVVRFFSRSVGFVGGFCYASSPWYLYATADGGRHWPSLSLGVWGGFSDIDIAGSVACAVGYVPYEMGSYPPVLVSTDRGKNWQPRSLPWSAALWDVELPNVSTIYAVGGSDAEAGVWLYRSNDAGLHWDRTPTPVGPSWAAMHFSDGSRGVLVGGSGRTYVTFDAGSTWSRR